MLLTPQMADLLTDGFRTIIDEEVYTRWEPQYSQVFHVETSTKPDENDSEITGFGLMPVKTEGAAIVYDDPQQAFDTTYTHLTYGMGFQASEEMVEDDQYRKIRNMPRQLARSAIETVETIDFNHLNRAFNSSYTGADGLELCSTAHLLQGGGTYQNELTSAADLSATSLEQAFIDIAAWTDHRGKKIRCRPSKLIIHPTNDWTSVKLLQSQLDPESSNNNVNPARGRLSVLVSPYLTDTDAWFIQCDQHFMYHFWRRAMRNGRDQDFDTGNLRHKIDFRMSSGWSSPIGIFGSPGV